MLPSAWITWTHTQVHHGQADQELIPVLKNTQMLKQITGNLGIRDSRAKNKDHRAKIELSRFLRLGFLSVLASKKLQLILNYLIDKFVLE